MHEIEKWPQFLYTQQGVSDDISPKYLALIALGPLTGFDAFGKQGYKIHLPSSSRTLLNTSPTMSATTGIAAVAKSYQSFNPRAYLQNNYMPPRANFASEEFVVPWKLRCLADAFATGR